MYPTGYKATTSMTRRTSIAIMRGILNLLWKLSFRRRTVRVRIWVNAENQARLATVCQWYKSRPHPSWVIPPMMMEMPRDNLLVTERHNRCLESIGPNVHIWCICPGLWRFAPGVDIGFSSAADKSKIWCCYKAAEYLNNCEYSFRSSGVIFTPIPSISGFDCNGG